MDYLLLLITVFPIVSALPLMLPIKAFDCRKTVWSYALLSTLVTFLFSLIAVFNFDFAHAGAMQLTGSVRWVDAFGLSFGYGIDSISLWLMLLTTFLMPIIVLGSLTAVNTRIREFYFWLIALETFMLGTFVATDIIFFYLCFEFTLVPLYILIGVFGSSDRLRAAKVFFLYTFTGSMLTFAGVMYVVYINHLTTREWSFNIQELYTAAAGMSVTEQAWVLGALMAGFAVKVPIFPVHTWLPLAHTEAPTAGSVILAGVLLKLGTYGLLRFALPMCPEAVVEYAWLIGIFAVLGVLVTALICWVQTDVKKLIAYSSVSHLGFCVLGLFALDADNTGAVGSVMYMINHGLSTGALFLCIGMIYERFHTREMAKMSGLGRVIPVWASFTVFFVLASVGLPGLNGFVSEFLTLIGAFLSPSNVLGFEYAAFAGMGMIFAAIYLLYMVGKVIFGPVKVPDVHNEDGSHDLKDLNGREILTLLPLAAGCLILGLFPYNMLSSLEAPVGKLTQAGKAAALQEPGLVQTDANGTPLRLVLDDQAVTNVNPTADRAAER
ncbi:MAG: NADH-quinone oxidoreductase subunit M [Phycisphaerales bacterium]